MWRSDGAPAAHPTFSLVVMNHKMKSQLMKSGNFVLNTDGIDVEQTCEDLRNAEPGDELDNQVQKLMEQAMVHTSNVPGTKAYWRSKFHEFTSLSLHKSHVVGDPPSFFHTGSIAEYHDYSLRALLQNYVNQLSNPPEDLVDTQILTNDAAFVRAV